MEYGASRYPLSSHVLIDRKRKRFLAFARNDNMGKAAFSYRKPSSWEVCEAAFSLLPLEGGAPKGRRLALLVIARGLAPSYQSLLILDALIPIYYLQGGTHI